MTDPRQTSRDSATSARSKTFTEGPPEPSESGDFSAAWRAEVEGRHDRPMMFVSYPPAPKRQWITGHGIGWLVQLLVGLATLYLIIRGNR